MALAKVPREQFVPADLAARAYDNRPLPIGHGQTISQPLIVAVMTHLLRLGPDARVLEVGTGSGYQTAILAELAREVVTIEVVEDLAAAAPAKLEALGLRNIEFARRRRRRRLPRAGAVRRHHGHRRRAQHPAGADRSAGAGRPAGDSARRAIRWARTCSWSRRTQGGGVPPATPVPCGLRAADRHRRQRAVVLFLAAPRVAPPGRCGVVASNAIR